MWPSEDSKRKLVKALLRLNKISGNKAAINVGLKRQNFYVWLNGVNSAISDIKKLELLDLLGVRYGQLDSSKIHRWCIQDMDDASLVISTLIAPQELLVMGIAANEGDAILRLDIDDRHHAYLLLHRPFIAEVPSIKITAAALGIGTQMDSIIPLSKDQWTDWLEPGDAELGLIARTMDAGIQSERGCKSLNDDMPGAPTMG